jgi:hypothetical protein
VSTSVALPALTSARRRVATDDAAEITPPTHIGAVERLGGQIDEQSLDANLEARLLARLADDACLLALVVLSPPPGTIHQSRPSAKMQRRRRSAPSSRRMTA